MKSIRTLFFLGMVCITLRADILRLRDGRMITGQFMGATQTEIWFKAETPGEAFGAAAYRVEEVESLTFGPAPGSVASNHEAPATLRSLPRARQTGGRHGRLRQSVPCGREIGP
ncbi:MAG TPA: hypothetical protein VKX39_07870 [Bryobacteraceae bacterium]|nr:hypothetical protein [Bryobacteraceae bacterium]